MGRPRKPIGLHVLDGTARKGRMEKRKDELKLPSRPIGPPPEYLTPAALEEWKLLTEDPDYSQILSCVHRGALIQLCVLHGRMVEDARGEPMTASQMQTLNSLRMQFGITPASQSKVKAPKADKPANKWSDVG
jgi:phage terminase small subunit